MLRGGRNYFIFAVVWNDVSSLEKNPYNEKNDFICIAVNVTYTDDDLGYYSLFGESWLLHGSKISKIIQKK